MIRDKVEQLAKPLFSRGIDIPIENYSETLQQTKEAKNKGKPLCEADLHLKIASQEKIFLCLLEKDEILLKYCKLVKLTEVMIVENLRKLVK